MKKCEQKTRAGKTNEELTAKDKSMPATQS
jgi:hypothetical protein